MNHSAGRDRLDDGTVRVSPVPGQPDGIVLISDPRVLSVPVSECGEPLAVSFNPGTGRIPHDGGMAAASRHISEYIGRSAEEVYAYASNPVNLPHWAPGLGSSVEGTGGQWFVETPAGRVRFAFAPQNELGVLDHYLTLDSGEVIYVPMRVIPAENGSEVIFTLRRRPGMTDEEFQADGDAVASDLASLRSVLESGHRHSSQV